MSKKRNEPDSSSASLIAASVHNQRLFELQKLVFDTLQYDRAACSTRPAFKLKRFAIFLMETFDTTLDAFNQLPLNSQRSAVQACKFPPPHGAQKFFEVRNPSVVCLFLRRSSLQQGIPDEQEADAEGSASMAGEGSSASAPSSQGKTKQPLPAKSPASAKDEKPEAAGRPRVKRMHLLTPLIALFVLHCSGQVQASGPCRTMWTSRCHFVP